MQWPAWLSFGSRKSATLTTLDILSDLLGGRLTHSGASVNWKTALETTTALACARVIAEGIAQVPLKLMQDSADGRSKLPAKDHPLYPVLYRRPNPWQTSFEYRETIGLHAVLCGNHYSFKNVVRGNVVELIPFEPQHVQVRRLADGSLVYRVQLPGATAMSDQSGELGFAAGQTQDFAAEAIWHVKGPSWNSYLGLDAVHLAREAIGLALSTEETHARLHRNGVQTTGMYSVDKTLSEPQYEALRKWIDKYQAGKENAGRPMILDNAAKWISQVMSGVDAQHLETRKYQVEEICRAMRVMPIMVGYSDKASTYASAEQMFLAHLVHTIAPWYERLEQSIDCNLLTPADMKAGIYACFVEEGLLRGSLKDTKDMLLGYVNGGLMTPNEGRAKLDLNPDDDPESDELRIPVNTVQTPEPGANTVPAAGDE